ncbi:MAG: serine/threonine protein phosphatase, partial [Verrucomicrobiae bacterium]|nr:serine/threonine protein phosphatase [Verrucomicrobiae bacterium]
FLKPMTTKIKWEFEDEAAEMAVGDTWLSLVLSPLSVVASCNGWNGETRHVVFNSALSKNLVPPDGEVGSFEAAMRALDQMAYSPTLRERKVRRLNEFLSRLPEARSSVLWDQIYDAMLAIAQESLDPSGVLVDDRESRELHRLTVAYLQGRRRNLVAPETPSEVGEPSPASSDAPPPAAKLPPWKWAAGWDMTMADAAFETLAGMHAAHEREWNEGRGRLDSVVKWDSIVPHPDRIWCDDGVAVAPASWAGRTTWIVGDLHGDADSLDRALRVAGVTTGDEGDRLPDGVALAFLGDLGDRGPGTLAVWLRVAALKVRFPDRVLLVRGNHEEVETVKLSLADGTPLRAEWMVPSTTNLEAYLMLGLALQCRFENLAMVFGQLPDVAWLPGGVLLVHGSLPPRWKDRDGWPATWGEEGKRPYRISGVHDLRKRELRRTLRWTDVVDREEVDFGWEGISRRSRLFASGGDHRHWTGLLGSFRLVHGHTHPPEGGRFEWNGEALALNTSRHTARRQAIARWEGGILTVHDITE